MSPILSPLLDALSKLVAATMERVPEVRAALAPYLHARVKLTLRVDMELDGAGGPLPDPVVELVQGAMVSAEGLALDGPPRVHVAMRGADVG